MEAYLTVNPPDQTQWYDRRNRALTGCTVLHTAENAFDELGEDTGAEGVAEFIRHRKTYGSYHDIVDSDSNIYLVDYIHGAFHDGTGSNNWALSLSFAVRTTDWSRMSRTKVASILDKGAVAFLRQESWRKANNCPLTELRLLTKAQSDAGMSGFTYHGYRDPTRRTDPGVKPPNLFPFNEFIVAIKRRKNIVLPAPPPTRKEREMILIRNSEGRIVLLGDGFAEWVPDAKTYENLAKTLGPYIQLPDGMFNNLIIAAKQR